MYNTKVDKRLTLDAYLDRMKVPLEELKPLLAALQTDGKRLEIYRNNDFQFVCYTDFYDENGRSKKSESYCLVPVDNKVKTKINSICKRRKPIELSTAMQILIAILELIVAVGMPFLLTYLHIGGWEILLSIVGIAVGTDLCGKVMFDGIDDVEDAIIMFMVSGMITMFVSLIAYIVFL